MKIKVTQDHIDKGKQSCSGECPIALALIEATGLEVSVYEHIMLWKGILIGDGEYLYDDPTPQHVLDRLKNFDKNGVMTPFEFEINYER